MMGPVRDQDRMDKPRESQVAQLRRERDEARGLLDWLADELLELSDDWHVQAHVNENDTHPCAEKPERYHYNHGAAAANRDDADEVRELLKELKERRCSRPGTE